MPEQFITTRAYLHTDKGRFTYTQEAMELIQSMLERRAATYADVSITRLSSLTSRYMSAAGDTKWCTVTNTRLVCSDACLLNLLRQPSSFYRKSLPGTLNAVLSFWTCELGQATRLRYLSLPPLT